MLPAAHWKLSPYFTMDIFHYCQQKQIPHWEAESINKPQQEAIIAVEVSVDEISF